MDSQDESREQGRSGSNEQTPGEDQMIRFCGER